MTPPLVPLGEVCDMDRRGLRPDDPDATRLPLLGVENVGPDTGVLNLDADSRVGAGKSTSFRFDARHVLYAKLRPYLNKVATPDFAGRCSTELVPLLPRPGVDRDFLACLLRRKETVAFVMSSVTGSRMPRTDMKALMSMPVPLPPLDEQRRIVDILNRTARIETLRARSAERLREFVPALFVKMFGDPVENPMGWRTEPLGGVILNGPQNGLYRPKSAYGSGTPILRIDGFYEGRVTDPACWQRVRLDRATVKKFALRKDDIVINRVNSRPFLGKSAIIPDIEEPTVFESNMMRIGLDPSQILPKFLISMLQIGSIKNQLCVNAKEAINQSSINQTDVLQLLVVAPPLALQRRYAEIVEVARAVARVRESSARTAAALMASLVFKLLENDGSVGRTVLEPAVHR